VNGTLPGDMPGVLALAQGPLLSPWIVFPVAAAAMAIIGVHAEALRRADMPPSRRRILRFNAWVMLLSVPLIAFGFGAAGPNGIGGGSGFIVVWSAVFMLVGVVLMLACVDMLNTLRLARRRRREWQEQVRRVLAEHGPAPNDEPRDSSRP
jgi:peptidoglycan/LPS O-acetylase OafA/YrhL